MKFLFSFVLLFLSVTIHADTASEIEAAIQTNLKNTQSENEAATLGDIHSQSPTYLTTQKMLKQIFANYELKYELLNYQFVGQDNEYAYARVKQKTTKVSGPAFKNNVLDLLMIFKKEDGSWKIWTQTVLTLDYK